MAERPNNNNSLPDIQQVRDLLLSLESGDYASAEELLDHVTSTRESHMFNELGKLTREIHEALTSFRLDSRITQLTEDEIPDAKERLNYVIEMTSQSAHRTLNAVEASLPLSEQIEAEANELLREWDRFRSRQMSVAEFRELSRRVGDFFSLAAQGAATIRVGLSDVMMAQDFQDLTGQMIRQVILLVHEVEEKLVDLVRVAGRRMHSAAPPEEDARAAFRGEGPMPPQLASDDRVTSQDDVDDLLSSLGF